MIQQQTYLKAVSYTHLDVYKRQAMTSADALCVLHCARGSSEFIELHSNTPCLLYTSSLRSKSKVSEQPDREALCTKVCGILSRESLTPAGLLKQLPMDKERDVPGGRKSEPLQRSVLYPNVIFSARG